MDSRTMRQKKLPERTIDIIKGANADTWSSRHSIIWNGSAEAFLDAAPAKPIFDLIISSPPYNIGKVYEERMPLALYLRKQSKLLKNLVQRLKPNGSLCWQVGNYVRNGEIFPLDLEFHKIFRKLGLKLRNRIVWRFGHGLHTTRRFSGRYEVVLWYTKGDDYFFNLNAVRLPSKYPGKRSYKGKNRGQYSGNPKGKNPEDVWDIPNIKGNHIEKTAHPCQFPVGLVERLVLSLTKRNAVVFDPYAGVCSTGVGAILHGRRFVGCEKSKRYCEIGQKRLVSTLAGTIKYRPHDKPIYDHRLSKLSVAPRRT
jgi:adenine-specific DNA-methyltransferase